MRNSDLSLILPLLEESQGTNARDLVILFPKSKSAGYSLALLICKQMGEFHREIEIPPQHLHAVTFSLDKKELQKALALLDLVITLKSVQIFFRGNRIDDIYPFVKTLRCFVKANSCVDSKAHCMVTKLHGHVTDERKPFSLPNGEPINRIILPCALIAQEFTWQTVHPSSLEDQFQAKAVKAGCSWCPNFDATQIKRVSGPA